MSVLTIAGVMLLFGMRIYVSRWFQRRTARLRQLMAYSSLQERLLEDRSRQIAELESVWEIDEAELTSARKIDEGAFEIPNAGGKTTGWGEGGVPDGD